MWAVWSSASFPAKVWDVSNMFPGKSSYGGDSWCYQVQLVGDLVGWFKFRSLVLL